MVAIEYVCFYNEQITFWFILYSNGIDESNNISKIINDLF